MIPLQKEIRSHANAEKAKTVASFFKTGKGQYGEGDVFLGLTVPQSRSIARGYVDLPSHQIEVLLASKYHEERLIALLILVEQFQSGNDATRRSIFDFYLAHLDRINNWDLVDLSADKIVGMYLFKRGKKIPQNLIRSNVLWERRVAMVATFAFIKCGDASESLRVAQSLLGDREDLMHKASGWMLREVGKRVSREELHMFLEKHAAVMPRTMLRYAIEHFPSEERKKWLSFGKNRSLRSLEKKEEIR